MQLVSRVFLGCASGLVLEGMERSVGHEHRLRVVLVRMRHRIITLGVVESNNEQSKGADNRLLERRHSHVRTGESTLCREHSILVHVELFLDVSPKHFIISPPSGFWGFGDSGARETIFINCSPRSSRVTGPNMRVPIGCN